LIKKYIGQLLVLFAIILWALSGPTAKYLYHHNFSSFTIIQTRSTFSFLVLLIICLIFFRQHLRIEIKDAMKFMLLGVIGLAGSNFFYYTCIKYVSVSTGIMIQYTAPFFVMLFAIIAKQEKSHYLKILFLSLAFIACFFAVSGGDLSYFSINMVGVLLALSSACTWSFYNIYHKYIVKKYSLMTELFYILCGASLLWFIINPNIFVDIKDYPLKMNMILFGFALLSVLAPLIFYNYGLQYLKASQATSIGLLEPVFVALFAYIFIGETMSFIQIVSALCVLVSIYLLEYSRMKIDTV
jgi:drug/metabolite transporter (DMT)-like permease